ncbi:hypothetical protein Tco_0167667 [Tanacetum coccineum]
MASPPYNPLSQSSLIQSFNRDDNLEPLWVPLLNLINTLHLKIRKVHPNPLRRISPPVKKVDVSTNSVQGNARRAKGFGRKYKSGSNEWYCYDLAHKEYYATYDTTFTLVEAGLKRELELEKPKLQQEERMEQMRLTQHREL